MANNYGVGINGAPAATFGLSPGQKANMAGTTPATKAVTPVTTPVANVTNAAPVFDFSAFKFGAPAGAEAANDKNYLALRNLHIASQLGGAGITDAKGIMGTLKNLPGWNASSPKDKSNTVNNILGLIKSGEALDPTNQKIAAGFAQNYSTNPGVANQFQTIANDYGQASKSQQQILDFFKQYETAINPYLNNYTASNKKIGDDVTGQLNAYKDQFMSQYGTDGEQRKRLQSYYGNVADVLASEQAKTSNEIDAQARKSGASLGATRVAKNKALGDNLKLATEYKAKEVSDYDNLYKTVNDYLKGYVEAYGASQDKYVKDTYAKLLDFKNQLGSALINSQAQFEQLKVQDALQQAAKTGISIKNT